MQNKKNSFQVEVNEYNQNKDGQGRTQGGVNPPPPPLVCPLKCTINKMSRF